MKYVAGDKELKELIAKNMELYHEVIKVYNFKTE